MKYAGIFKCQSFLIKMTGKMSSSSEMVRPFSYTVKTALFALSDSYIC